MAAISDTYQEKVGLEQGADRFYMKEDGEFKFYDQDLTGLQLRDQLVSHYNEVTIGQGATSTLLSVVNLPSGYKWVNLSLTSTLVSASFWLTSCVAGQEVYLKIHAGSCASGQIDVSLSGCSLVGVRGTNISGFELTNSAASCPIVHLVCHTDDEWEVVGVTGFGNYVE